jgi:hypothetical protein
MILETEKNILGFSILRESAFVIYESFLWGSVKLLPILYSVYIFCISGKSFWVINKLHIAGRSYGVHV